MIASCPINARVCNWGLVRWFFLVAKNICNWMVVWPKMLKLVCLGFLLLTEVKEWAHWKVIFLLVEGCQDSDSKNSFTAQHSPWPWIHFEPTRQSNSLEERFQHTQRLHWQRIKLWRVWSKNYSMKHFCCSNFDNFLNFLDSAQSERG